MTLPGLACLSAMALLAISCDGPPGGRSEAPRGPESPSPGPGEADLGLIPLFLDAGPGHPGTSQDASPAPGRKRRRWAEPNPVLLAWSQGPPEIADPGYHFQLNLFPDASWTVSIDKVESGGEGRYILHGTVPDGRPESQFLMVLDSGSASASFSGPDHGDYVVHFAGPGLVEIVEVDGGTVPRFLNDAVSPGPGP